MRNAFCLLLLLVSPAFCAEPWKLVWSDEFNTNGPPNPANWNYDRGFVRNEERQWYPATAGAEHSRLLVGYRDDSKQPGGGMFFTEDSATGSYEEVTYQFVKTDVGDVFWVDALGKPAPMATRGTSSAEAKAGTVLPPRPFHLERRAEQRWEVTFKRQHGPLHGVVYYAVPPEDPCQTIRSVELFAETRKGRMEAVRVTDAGPFKKPLLKLEINSLAPFTVTARVDVQLYHTELTPGAAPGRVKPLAPLQHREFLDDGWPNEKARAWFTGWMKSHKLIRGGEEEGAFAFRVLKFMQEHFRYVIPDKLPAYKAMVARDPEMGDWHYTIETFSGECWRLSDTYCRVMRLNGIPARLVSGNYFGKDSGHHLRSLIFLPEVGWVPMEVTAAVSSRTSPPLEFFGTWGGTMLIGNQNIGFELKGPKGNWNIGTLDGLGFAAADGKWEFPSVEIKAKVVLPAKGK